MTAANERYKLNKELAQMLKGGVIMDVTTPEQAHIAEEAICIGLRCQENERLRYYYRRPSSN